jgi:ATP-dependent helicase/DNAse subunit B
VERLADSWNTKSKELTLSVIIDRTEDEFSKSLQQCFERLKSLVTEIRKIADENSLQASGRLKSVESSIRFMSQLQNSPPTYSDAGKLQNGTSTMSRTEA